MPQLHKSYCNVDATCFVFVGKVTCHDMSASSHARVRVTSHAFSPSLTQIARRQVFLSSSRGGKALLHVKCRSVSPKSISSIFV